MEIALFVVDKRANELSPSPEIGTGLTVQVQLRGDVSVTAPVFTLTRNVESFDYNYVYVPLWRRWYFVDKASVSGNIWFIYCTEDYLNSWRNEILESTLYCLRSSNRYNPSILDSKFPSPVDVTTLVQERPTPWLSIDKGRYIVAISSGGNNNKKIGTNSYYVMSASEMTQFMHDVMGSSDFSISGVADSIAKTMINPLQYIQSCVWLPCDVDAKTTTVNSIDFGWWSSSASAKVMHIEKNSDCVTEFEVVFTPQAEMIAAKREYLKYPPYSTLKLTAYPFGSMQMPREVVSEYMKNQPIRVRVIIDNLTGTGSLVITSDRIPGPLYITTSQVGVDIPVGQVLQDFAGSALSAVGSLASLTSGSVIGGVAGIKSSIESLAPDVNVTGTTGGFAQLMLDDAWTLTRSFYTVEPSTDLLGEPCCANMKVETLVGYAQFADAEVRGPMLLSEKNAIASLLEGGIYIA